MQFNSTDNYIASNSLKQAVNAVNEVQQEAGAKRTAFEMGDRSVSLGDVMVASSKSGIALDATVQVRNKFVEAYKEIMSISLQRNPLYLKLHPYEETHNFLFLVKL